MLNSIYPTTAMFPGETFLSSINKIYSNQEKFNINPQIIQLCPQQLGIINNDLLDYLTNKYNNYNIFRLHANVNLLENNNNFIFDASVDIKNKNTKLYLEKIKEIIKHKKIDKIYSIHAGYKNNIINNNLKLLDNAKKIRDCLKIDLVIEGLYPNIKKNHLISSIEDYEFLANSFPFAFDLSHINIVFQKENKKIDNQWIIDMCNHSNCYEIHISGNDGINDKHLKLNDINSNCNWIKDIILKNKFQAKIFTEENYREISFKN